MPAASTDKFIKGARRWSGQIGGGGVADGVVDVIPLVSAIGLPTDTAVEITIDRVDANGAATQSKEEVIRGVVSGSNIINAVRGVEGTPQAHAAGAVVEVKITADQWNRMVDGITAEHKQDGTHKVFGINAPQGFLINGKIVPSVTSNNLTVAIKTLAGNDPSASDPVYVRIGDTVRSVTSALSLTLNAGTNWFNAGSVELAAKEIDYFVYLGYDAGSGVILGISRVIDQIYGGGTVFSSTATSEKHFANNVSVGLSGVVVEVVGRFAATLSAGAGYTWSVPTFTAVNLIQRPIYETRTSDYLPVWANGGSIGNGILQGRYKIIGNMCYSWVRWSAGSTTTFGSGIYSFSTPFSTLNALAQFMGSMKALDSGTQHYSGSVSLSNNSNAINMWLGGAMTQQVGHNYPAVWANGDSFDIAIAFPIA
jgi:hypothetical protein